MTSTDSTTPADIMKMSFDELRRLDDDPRWQAHIDHDEMVDARKPTTIPACPDWCRHPAGHDYDSVMRDDETFTRYHESAPRGSATITQEEQNKGGHVTLTAPVITSWGAGGSEELTAEAARQTARELVAAADRLEEITGGQR